MKPILITLFLFCCLKSFGQTRDERQLLALSKQIFSWEVDLKTDSLDNIFHEKFTVMSSSGRRLTRAQYMARLTGGTFSHNKIDIQENAATVTNNTGLVMGKGKFTVTNNGHLSVLLLAFTEVFTRSNGEQPWKLLAIHANPLP
ncbi:nuclear transport factor 2 family protein [Mucilaginibacter sp.]|uniref:nuclear transport factor 2 family protein n=1 Tax=Mucilaginibacter sp. TaxID=1882438 RepID=UPI0025F72C6E|nr:nuclear transport factor 2 family protein [Mucilaginibacter sp.]